MDKNVPRAKIKHCSILDPFVLILREDETIGLFIGELERGKIRRKDMSPMGDKVRVGHIVPIALNTVLQTSRYIAGSFFNDTNGLFTTRSAAKSPDGSNSTSTLQGVMNPSEKTQWLMLCRPQGVMEVRVVNNMSLERCSSYHRYFCRSGLYPSSPSCSLPHRLRHCNQVS